MNRVKVEVGAGRGVELEDQAGDVGEVRQRLGRVASERFTKFVREAATECRPLQQAPPCPVTRQSAG